MAAVKYEPVLTRGIPELDLLDINVYEANGGYQAMRKVFTGAGMTPQAVHEEVLKANLRGRGGAGFPTGKKWQFLPNDGRPRYLICNADESEPGTANNRVLLQWNPHQLIEGIILAAYAINAAKSFIYIRGEFWEGYKALVKAVAQAREKGYLGQNIMGSGFSQEIVVHRGAGAYICGEESALINSLEGRRGEPRLKPPFPAIVGLYGQPTCVNNVESLSCVTQIINRGADWFLSMGTPNNPGPKIYTISGRVKRPGNYELPMGVTLRELIYEWGGGMLDGRQFKCVQPGGGSAPILVDQHLDAPMDFDGMRGAGSMFGTGGLVVFDDTCNLAEYSQYLVNFFASESCGQCTPCREGTNWLNRLTQKMLGQGITEDEVKTMNTLPNTMSWAKFGTTICPLSDSSSGFILSAMKWFPEDFAPHIKKSTREEVRMA